MSTFAFFINNFYMETYMSEEIKDQESHEYLQSQQILIGAVEKCAVKFKYKKEWSNLAIPIEDCNFLSGNRTKKFEDIEMYIKHELLDQLPGCTKSVKEILNSYRQAKLNQAKFAAKQQAEVEIPEIDLIDKVIPYTYGDSNRMEYNR
jgi:hypothetical protein